MRQSAGARAREGRKGGREGSPGPAPPPCTTIKLRNQRLPLGGFLVTLGGTAPALPSLVSHRSLDIGFLPLPERHLELPPHISWQITPSAGRCGRRGGWRGGDLGWALGALSEGSLTGCVPHPGPSSYTLLELQRPSPLCSISQISRN